MFVSGLPGFKASEVVMVTDWHPKAVFGVWFGYRLGYR